jgi:phosphomannomutase
MQVNPGIFKAYDIRGIYPTDLNEEIAYAIGRAFVTFLQTDTVIVGRDMRTSGPQIFEAVTNGIRDQGADVINIGMVSTDQYYYTCGKFGHPGMMVTASHNPKAYNGFKMVRRMPYLLSGDQGIQDLCRIVENEDFAPANRRGEIRDVDLMDEFVQSLLNLIDVQAIKGRTQDSPLRVIADTANGAVGPALAKLYDHLPVHLTPMYFEPDGNLPNHGLDPLQPENRAELQERVKAEGADIGFAFDGDGDRFFVIDDRGEFIPGDFVTALMGQYMLRKHPNEKIIYDVRASWAVPDLIKEVGGTPLIERVGHAFIKRRMADENALFAGEVTGHYYFRDFNFADSGMIPSLVLLEMLSTSGKKLSELLAPIESKYFVSGEINSTVPDAEVKMQQIAERYGDGKVEHLDGVSVSYDDWHFNVRASNTEPLLRLNLEALSKEKMEAKRDEVVAFIRS